MHKDVSGWILSEANSGTEDVIRCYHRQHEDLISGRTRMDVKTSLKEYRHGAYFKETAMNLPLRTRGVRAVCSEIEIRGHTS